MDPRGLRNVVAFGFFVALGVVAFACVTWWTRTVAEQEARAREERARLDDDNARAAARRDALTDAEARRRRERAAADAADAQVRADTPGGYWSRARNLRPVDRAALALLGRPVVDHIADGTPGQPWRVDVFSEDGRFARVTVDLDRDGALDETWTVRDDGHIERRRSPDDDGERVVGETLTLEGFQSAAR
jgi:hypothetical protein